LAATEKRLTPMLTDKGLVQKVNDAASEPTAVNGETSMLAQAVGINIGSPEFQRR